MSESTFSTTDEADRSLAVWRTYTRRLAGLSLLSIALALPMPWMNLSADGRDPFFLALASQFVIWGLIDLAFAVHGLIGLRSVGRLTGAARDAEVLARREKILAALHFNRWLNAVWVATGVGLLIWGYVAWSPSLVGHGLGVTIQAVGLVVFDRAFRRALVETSRA